MRTRTGMPIDADVRERLRAAQRAEATAIGELQRALSAEADARTRLDEVIVKQHADLAKASRAVRAAQALLVNTSGLERAALLLDIPAKVLRSAVKEVARKASVQAMSNETLAATAAPTTAPAKT